MASVYFLKFKTTLLVADRSSKNYTIVDELGNFIFTESLVKQNKSVDDGKRIDLQDYNYLTNYLVDETHMNCVNVFNPKYIEGDKKLVYRQEQIARFMPGSKIDELSVSPASTGHGYAIKLLDEKSGNYCIINSDQLGLSTDFYISNNLVFTESQHIFMPISGMFTQNTDPTMYSGQCVFVKDFDTNGNIVSLNTTNMVGVRNAVYDDGSVRLYTATNNLRHTNDFITWLNSLNKYEKPPTDPTDPYNKGGHSDSSGGGGTFGCGNTIFGGVSDSIDIPPLPTASASNAGFITLFNPTLGQLNNLANYMWSDLFSLDTFKKIFADPMDCILGLSIVPVKPASAGTSAVKIGNVSTDVSMNKTSSQYVAVDCGTIDVKEYWGAYLDYAPYTQCEIYLPYVGTKQISVDDVMNKAVHVVYHVDILSGACNAYVKCGDSVLYTFVGQCSSSIPISGNDWTNVLNGAISVAGKIGLAMATGGATALMSGLGAASSIISSSKPTVERSGAMSSTGGLLGIQKPYLILTRPKQALPENQNKYTGYPSFITMALSECTGYTEVDSVHLENMSCTDEEAQEIENLLKSGVIF